MWQFLTFGFTMNEDRAGDSVKAAPHVFTAENKTAENVKS